MRLINKFFKKQNEIRSDVRVIEVNTLEELKKVLRLKRNGKIIEDDLDAERDETDKYQRRRRDAEVLSLIVANIKDSKLLDIGTHLGKSAARMAVNSPTSKIYTVNIHPDEANTAGVLITDILTEKQIGSFYRSKKIQNINQIYANTKTWNIPSIISNLSLVYVDGCHDRDFVFSDSEKTFERLLPGGYILWHDFNPGLRSKFEWIDAAMSGVEDFLESIDSKGPIYHLKHSWIGIYKKV